MINNIFISVFTDKENAEKTEDALKKFVPFNLEEKKLKIDTKRSSGFGEKEIIVKSIEINKMQLAKKTFEHITAMLDENSRIVIFNTIESRLSDDFHFFIRLDKIKMLEGEAVVTDSGDCFHIKASITSFPQKKESAIEELRELFVP